MIKLLAIALLAVLATGCSTVKVEHTSSPQVIEVQGQTLLVQKIDEIESKD